ncbi:hypothetical protein [Rhizobium leguminosarum]|uniref:hypothetical protein n=1 Tax=Rhizobium leguminosarum TaxID=384 RepID=UPI0014417943|nr:hypothetical protein [Rhizobium leguminosarum]MBY5868468.1 hypothetical protein [Rhizobium leguminosarum]NKM07753.1 hypothetical protein [Rhizobium leguminosarum bv. viciae]
MEAEMKRISIALSTLLAASNVALGQTCDPGPKCSASAKAMSAIVKDQLSKAETPDAGAAALARYCVSKATSLVAKDCADEFSTTGNSQCVSKAMAESDNNAASATAYLEESNKVLGENAADDFAATCR